MSALLRNFVIFGLLIYGLQSLAMGADFDTQAGIESFIENFVLEQLPGPAGDAVSVVKNSPDLMKTGLILWLNGKMIDAATDGDWEKHDRYLAFYTCIAKGDCGDLQTLASEKSQNEVGTHYSGVAISETKNGKTWPFELTLIGPDTDGTISGQIEWTSLDSIHKIEGSKTATGITFTETAYIKKGYAVLNCRYNLNSEGDSFTGTWDGCDDGDHGTISMKPG
jgi:hypothetical protein